jgi:uncharacterized protein (DUF2147 family)
MDRLIKEALLPLGLCFFSSLSLGQTSPAGVWNTFDEDSGQAKSQVTIVEKNGVFTGIVTDFLRPNADRTRRCEKCTDDRTDEKILGMEIIRNVKASQAANQWGEGEILDPENGKTYRVQLTLAEGGQSLAVKGSLFIFSRTQTWTRAKP